MGKDKKSSVRNKIFGTPQKSNTKRD